MKTKTILLAVCIMLSGWCYAQEQTVKDEVNQLLECLLKDSGHEELVQDSLFVHQVAKCVEIERKEGRNDLVDSYCNLPIEDRLFLIYQFQLEMITEKVSDYGMKRAEAKEQMEAIKAEAKKRLSAENYSVYKNTHGLVVMMVRMMTHDEKKLNKK